jgi:hypothetical protein
MDQPNFRKKCIAVDFDGTLAQYDKFKGVGVYGPPVPSMLERVKGWMAEGHDVVIFTARVSDIWRQKRQSKERQAITEWLVANGLPKLIVTCHKSPAFDEIWDDRAVRVRRNTGEKA